MRLLSRWILLSALLALCILVAMSPALAQEESNEEESPSFKEALAGGKGSVFLRYRYETVTDDGVGPLRAHASTLRTTVSYETLPFKRINFYLEAENVSVLGDDELYNNGGVGDKNNGVTDRPVIADPALTAITGAYVKAALPHTPIVLGRREINHDNQRFIGAVGWRQHHQTFDAVDVSSQSFANTTLGYSFLAQVNRINGGSFDMASHLFRGDRQLGRVGEIKLFGYLLDYEESNESSSLQTYGGALIGSPVLASGLKLVYRIQLAAQRDFAGNPQRIESHYSHLIGGVGHGDFTITVGRELLSGSEEDGQFNVPLGTNHAFNGWADKFLVTPSNGLRDLYLAVDGRALGLSLSLRYHDFNADTGGADYGSEVDFQILCTAPWGQLVGFKGAFYDADRFAADTNKLWIWTQYRF